MKKVSTEDTAVIEALERNSGLTEANLRSCLRSEHGDSTALDRTLATGRAVQRGNKIYRPEDAPS